jgi:hypothetical protein
MIKIDNNIIEILNKHKKHKTEFELNEIEMYNHIRNELSLLNLEPSDDIIISEILFSVKKESTHDSITKKIIKKAIDNEKLFLKLEPNLSPHKMNGIILYKEMKEMRDNFNLKLFARLMLENNKDNMQMEDSYEYFLRKLNQEYSIILD